MKRIPIVEGDLFDVSTYDELMLAIYEEITGEDMPTNVPYEYDHSVTLHLTVRGPERAATTLKNDIGYHLERVFPKSKLVFEGAVRSLAVRGPNSVINSQELGAYHALAAEVFGRSKGEFTNRSRRAQREAVIGRRVSASSMTLAEFGKVMESLRDAKEL